MSGLRIKKVRPGPKADVALVFSTKDRTEFSCQTLEPLMRNDPFDLYWVDGSDTEEGRALPEEMAPRIPRLREIHYGVVGGPDTAIVYSLTYLRDKGYSYIGLLENDVLLPGDWFRPTMNLFTLGERDGLRVGSVSARCFRTRRLLQRPDYTIVYNTGAGMIMLKHDAVCSVLSRYRTTTGPEIQSIFLALTGVDPLSTALGETEYWGAATDWNFDISLLLDGYVSLATAPSLARNLDTRFDDNEIVQLLDHFDLSEVDDTAFTRFRERLLYRAHTNETASLSALPHFDLRTNCWNAFAHEVAAANRDFVRGNWKLKWSQCFGPFVFVAQEAGCQIEVPIFSEQSMLLCGFGPNCGSAEVEMGNTTAFIDCKRPEATNSAVGLEPMTEPGSMLRITVRESGFQFYGLMTSRVQSWHRGRYDFDYKTIAGII
jgi:hypothetical protein